MLRAITRRLMTVAGDRRGRIEREFAQNGSALVPTVLAPGFCDSLCERVAPAIAAEPDKLFFHLDRQPTSLVDEIFDQVATGVLIDFLFGEFGPSLYFPLCQSLFRRVSGAAKTHIGFHQDAVFMGAHFLSINCWIPMRDVGSNGAPGLELVRASLTEQLPSRDLSNFPRTEGPYAGYDAPPSFDAFRALYREALPKDAVSWAPDLTRGDGLVFNNFTIHRTRPSPGFDGTRLSLEIRCMSAADAFTKYNGPPDGVGMLILKGPNGPVLRQIRPQDRNPRR